MDWLFPVCVDVDLLNYEA